MQFAVIAHCGRTIQDYKRLKFRRGHAVAKVAIARKLAVRMYWMLRSGADYARLVRRQGSPGGTLVNTSSSLACLGALLSRAIAGSEERIMVGSWWPNRWLVEPESTVRFTSEPWSR